MAIAVTALLIALSGCAAQAPDKAAEKSAPPSAAAPKATPTPTATYPITNSADDFCQYLLDQSGALTALADLGIDTSDPRNAQPIFGDNGLAVQCGPMPLLLHVGDANDPAKAQQDVNNSGIDNTATGQKSQFQIEGVNVAVDREADSSGGGVSYFSTRGKRNVSLVITSIGKPMPDSAALQKAITPLLQLALDAPMPAIGGD
jgi:hypothetical protein